MTCVIHWTFYHGLYLSPTKSPWFGGIRLWKFVAIAGILLTSLFKLGWAQKNDMFINGWKLPAWCPFSGSILVYREYLSGSKFISSECVGFGMLRDLCIVDFHPCEKFYFSTSYIWHAKLGSHLFNQHTDPTRSCHLAVFCFPLLGWSWAKEWI